MPSYKAPVENTLFLLYDVLGFDRHSNLPGFSEATRDVVEAVLAEGAKVAEKSFQPLNRTGDLQGCQRLADGVVVTPNGFKEAFRAFAEGGWVGLSADPAFGGQGLPHTIEAAINEYASSANMALAMYAGLTQGAISALVLHGTDAQKSTYLPKMVSGTWTGTMNLTEPHCGTDLGLIKTRAVPNGDGSYAITGQKIFISAGDHDMTDNIVHLVLARIAGAPEGVKGISLFVAPRVLVNEDGSLGARNAVSCGAIEHKMGIHGNATCVMNYDGATGWLVGEENRGLPAMFTMMNEARLGVGIQGLAQSEVAYQNAAAYARERRQGRALKGPAEPDKPADPIIVHPDVRRTLLSIKAFNEAARALILWTAIRGDVGHVAEDAKERDAADDHMGLLTPVIKGVVTDLGFDNAVKAQQMFGGHGYIAEWGMEQFVRDARIAMIYEGANGVQAMDLIGRKLPRNGGRAVMAFFKEVDAFAKENAEVEGLGPYLEPLKKAREDLQGATMWFMANAMGRPDNAGAGASDYMRLFGLVALGLMWAMIAKAALAKKAAGEDVEAMDAKLVTGRFFVERMLPETSVRLSAIKAGADAVMALPAEAF
ncbi:acyl-CoA dehydrogenase C-terminal domain-containing protein [Methylopila sp. M107]|uniref:acyl-CoA dehydrogenase C-terminal domain-containing protein n=1 Tax=Methylopila sp. M107 TaxID=1101190 RepID=UPI00037C70DE|nr:acyl-CoA dehydrogenase C-terminal domain-containing protein [Methylopila sp. M107]